MVWLHFIDNIFKALEVGNFRFDKGENQCDIHTFRYSLFGKKVKMFRERQMGIVVEKEPDAVCVYGMDENYRILCAVPLCHPKFLKGAEYVIEFDEEDCARVCVGELQIVIDYSRKKCMNNKTLKCYGSDAWGQDVQIAWSEA